MSTTLLKALASGAIKAEDAQGCGGGGNGQYISETDGEAEMWTVHEQAPTACFRSHFQRRLWPCSAFQQTVATAVAAVWLPHQVLQPART
jgi:hypothetical protein